MFAKDFFTELKNEIFGNIRKEIFKNLKRESNDTYHDVMQNIRKELSINLERRGIDISNMEIDLKPDNSNVRVCIKGEWCSSLKEEHEIWRMCEIQNIAWDSNVYKI